MTKELTKKIKELADDWMHGIHEYGAEAYHVLRCCANDLYEILDQEKNDRSKNDL